MADSQPQLTGIEVNGVVYGFPTGTEVIANPTGTASDPSLQSLAIDGDNYQLDMLQYHTAAPTAPNTNGIKIVILPTEPAVKYDGYLYIIIPEYTVSFNITNGSHTGVPVIRKGGSQTLTITPQTGYKLPEAITVTGADYTYNNETGVVTISNPTGAVAVEATCESNTHKISMKAGSNFVGDGIYGWGFALAGVDHFGTTVFDSDSVADNAVLDISNYQSGSIVEYTITIYLNGVVVAQQTGVSIELTYQLPITSDTLLEVDNANIYITTNATGLDAPIKNIYCRWTSPSGSYYLKHLANNIAVTSVGHSYGTVVTARKFGIQGYNWTSSTRSFSTSIYDSYPSGTNVDSVSTGNIASFSTGTAIDITSRLQDGYAWS